MKKRKGIKKRYLLTVSSIMLAILSVLLLRSFDTDFERERIRVEKEINAILEFNMDGIRKVIILESKGENSQKARILRDIFANKISYKKLFDKKGDFKNFKYLPDREIYGLQLLNNAHIGFYYNSDNCAELDREKEYCAGIILDTNGYTRPNRFGHDQFFYKIYEKGFLAE